MIKSIRLLAESLFLIGSLAGCAPSGGSAAREADPDAQPGSGKASMSWDLSGRRDRSAPQYDIDAARSGPTTPGSD